MGTLGMKLPPRRKKPLDECNRCGCSGATQKSKRVLCDRCRRMFQMRNDAARKGKQSPSLQWMEDNIPKDMACKACGVTMIWRGQHSRKISLQHNRDGSMGFLCVACNIRHHYMPGDTFYSISPGNKWCSACGKEKPREAFHNHRTKETPNGKHTHCADCRKNTRRSNGGIATIAAHPESAP